MNVYVVTDDDCFPLDVYSSLEIIPFKVISYECRGFEFGIPVCNEYWKSEECDSFGRPMYRVFKYEVK